MTLDLEAAEKIINSKVVEKVYDDGISSPVKEGSKFLTDLVKVARFASFPIQVIANWQDRYEKRLKKSIEQVPEERRIDAPPSIAVPIMQQLSYIEDGSFLIELFQNLLSRTIDKSRNSEAHPAFVNIIQQLCPDEAQLLTELKQNQFKFVRIYYLDAEKRRFYDSKLESNEFDVNKFLIPEHFDMYLDHLYKLDLTQVVKKDSEAIFEDDSKRKQTASRETYTIGLTRFGALFVKACFEDKL